MLNSHMAWCRSGLQNTLVPSVFVLVDQPSMRRGTWGFTVLRRQDFSAGGGWRVKNIYENKIL